MEKVFNKKQWWRSPPVLVISLIAAAALLFLSGKAAVMAFADGENEITISFNANGDNGSPPASIRVQPGEYVTLPLQPDGMTKDGYTLVGWSQTPDNSGISYYPGKEARFYEDTVLYALWEKNMVITFDLNGGTGTAPAPVICKARDIGSYEEIVMSGKTQDMAKDGYCFIAWDTAPDGSGTTYYPGDTYYNISEDTLLYAVWQEVITVSFDANGGTGSVPDPIIPPPPTPATASTSFQTSPTKRSGSRQHP